MLDNLFWSILANRLYYGEAWASAKAFMLLFYVPADSDSQTAGAAAMEANKTGGANLVAVGAVAPGSRTQASAPWYVQGAPYETGLGSTAGGTLPDTAGEVGNILTVGSGGLPAWDPAGGSGISQLTGDVTAGPGSGSQATTITNAVKSVAAVGSTPSANGASIATTVLTLQPADATHPGLVTTGAQSFGGDKTFSASGVAIKADTGGGYPGLVLGADGLLFHSGNNVALTANTDIFMIAGGSAMFFAVGGLDLTGAGASGYIKMKDTSGVTRTCTIDGGTGLWVIT